MCGSDAVPQNRASISERKSSLSNELRAADLPERRAGARRQEVAAGGRLLEVDGRRASVRTRRSCRTPTGRLRSPAASARNANGPSGPVFSTPPGSLEAWPTGSQVVLAGRFSMRPAVGQLRAVRQHGRASAFLTADRLFSCATPTPRRPRPSRRTYGVPAHPAVLGDTGCVRAPRRPTPPARRA